MSHTWVRALEAYRYTVDTSRYRGEFAHRLCVKGAFDYSVPGDRDSTILFEKRFQDHAGQSMAHWYEVVFWKMYSQAGRRDGQTDRVIRQTAEAGVTADQLYGAACQFTKTSSRRDFEQLHGLFHFATNPLAIVATFPAFLAPDRFPMIDTRIAKWVRYCGRVCNEKAEGRPSLEIPVNANPLTLADWDFYDSWIEWTRAVAKHLSHITAKNWRPRDVEMAVFTAWGNRNEFHPRLQLNPWPYK